MAEKRFLQINNADYIPLGTYEGDAAPSYEIRSSDMYGARSGYKPLPTIIFWPCAQRTRK